jgi:hypothetical protein
LYGKLLSLLNVIFGEGEGVTNLPQLLLQPSSS